MLPCWWYLGVVVWSDLFMAWFDFSIHKHKKIPLLRNSSFCLYDEMFWQKRYIFCLNGDFGRTCKSTEFFFIKCAEFQRRLRCILPLNSMSSEMGTKSCVKSWPTFWWDLKMWFGERPLSMKCCYFYYKDNERITSQDIWTCIFRNFSSHFWERMSTPLGLSFVFRVCSSHLPVSQVRSNGFNEKYFS